MHSKARIVNINSKQRHHFRPEILKKLGNRIRACRHDRGMTQEALAHSLTLSAAYVSLIERGGRNPPFTTVVAIADALGVTVRDLIASW